MASSTIDQAIGVYVKASTEVQDVVGARVFYVEAEQGTDKPYVVYFVVDDPHTPHSFDASLTGQARVQFNSYSTSRYTALSLSDKIRDRLHLTDATAMDSVVVYSAMCTGSVVMREPEQDIFAARFDAIVEYEDA